MDFSTVLSAIVHVANLFHCANGTLDHLRIASKLSPHFLAKLSENEKPGLVKYKGFVKDFCDHLSSILGSQYEIVLLPEDQNVRNATVIGRDGSWDDLLGMIIRNEADLAIGIGHTEMTYERVQLVDFSPPILTSCLSVLYKRENFAKESDSGTLWTFFEPFPRIIWISFIIIAILYYAFIQIPNFYPAQRFHRSRNLVYSKKLAKAFLAIWLAFLFASYISNYCALKVIKVADTPRSLLDLVSQKQVKLGWLAHSAVESYFTNTDNAMLQKVFAENVGKYWLSSDEEGVNMVLQENGDFAFIMNSLMANIQTQSDFSLCALPHDFGPARHMAVAIPKGSNLRDRINHAVLLMTEQGTIESLQNRWSLNPERSSQCTSSPTPNSSYASAHVSLKEVTPLFIFAILGLLLTTGIAVFEIQFGNSKPMPHPRLPHQQIELLPKFNQNSV